MCSLLGSEKTRTAPLHPGMVEWFNCTLEAQLSMFVDRNHCNWDTLVPLMMAYRSAVHDTTYRLYTSQIVVWTRDAAIPIDKTS